METGASLLKVLVYGFVCAGAFTAGGAIAASWPLSARIRSYIQHVAAGLVFAAVGVEVLPDVLHRDLPWAAAGGFATGIALMLALRMVSRQFSEGEGNGGINWTFIGVVATDVFIDGILIGISAITDRNQGQQVLLVSVALSVELLSLGLSLVASMGQRGTSRTWSIATIGFMALSPLMGVIAGYFLGGQLSAGWMEGVLAFAAAALLYLAVEELLKEAHEVPETLASTALFFAAFLALLLVDMVSMQR